MAAFMDKSSPTVDAIKMKTLSEMVDLTISDIDKFIKSQTPGTVRENRLSSHRANEDKVTVKSHKSKALTRRSRESNSTTSMLLKKRAKAEAAKVSLEFAYKEAELKKQKARLEEEEQKAAALSMRKKSDLQTDLEYLNAQKDIEVAEAELRAIEEELSSDGDHSHVFQSVVEHVDTSERTRQYVEQMNQQYENQCEPDVCNRISEPALPQFSGSFVAPSNEMPSPSKEEKHTAIQENQITQFTNLTNFILRKDLLQSRLTNFDDKPENFVAWKNCFKSVVKELSISPVEELDLLIRWLGPESKEHAKSIRSATTNNPVKGCDDLWQRLDERYGSSEMVEAALKAKLHKFPKLYGSEPKRLYELSDILAEIGSLKENPKYGPLLSYFDTSVGILPIVNKLMPDIQGKWATRASKYKQTHDVPFPPFNVFRHFIKEMSTMLNDPSLSLPHNQELVKTKQRSQQKNVTVKKTDLEQPYENGVIKNKPVKCPLHGTGHSLNECKAFRKKSLNDRVVKQTLIYLKPVMQLLSAVIVGVHNILLLSIDLPQRKRLNINFCICSKCTSVCGGNFTGRSCAKAVLVKVYHKDEPNNSHYLYALIDDQSNCTLGRSEFFDLMRVSRTHTQPFTLSSCAGRTNMSGRRVSGFVVESLDGSTRMELPTVTECNYIPDDRQEIPTPNVIIFHEHLKDLPIPPLNPDASILLLIGRDLIEAHHVYDQRIGPKNTPFALKLNLGWVVIGDVCLGKFHQPNSVTVIKTNMIDDGRQTIMQPCSSSFHVKENFTFHHDKIGSDLFTRKPDDEKVGLSCEDRQFLQIMEEGFEKDSYGNWKAPLPFRNPRPRLKNNRCQALKRAYMLDASLKKNPIKLQHLLTFMKGITDSGVLEIAPMLPANKECWYLPLFGVYHPRKPEKIRGVFDSSVKYEGQSLNNVLLSGPNLTNELLGVLLRFRKDKIALIADIEQMFYSFLVREDHRDFLRFFWYRNNDPHLDLTEYRMRVHVFGNAPSPAVATYGLRKTVENADNDVKDYVNRNFYVDDGLMSVPTTSEAISLLKRTQTILNTEGKIRLHKIASNSKEVMKAFPREDLEKNLKTVDLCTETLPMQQSLGLAWDLNSDTLTFSTMIQEKPFTKRGLLSVVNSLFDPLGFIAPIVIHGRILLRELTHNVIEWDQPLSENYAKEWVEWKQSLHSLRDLQFPRMYTSVSLTCAQTSEVHIYSDASEKAISAVAYMRTTNDVGEINVGFIMGKSKLAPLQGHTIPRLELCAAVLATELAHTIFENLDLSPDSAKYYTDSKVVLGYVNNRIRRFYNYVSNRVNLIHQRSKPSQWNYVSTQDNPADLGTRCLTSAQTLTESHWIHGPQHLMEQTTYENCDFPLVDSDNDRELRPIASVKKTVIEKSLVDKFEKFSSWEKLVAAFSFFKRACRFHKGTESSFIERSVEITRDAEQFIIRLSQQMAFQDEIDNLHEKKPISRTSHILALSPFLDDNGILRVGGRLNQAPATMDQRNPIIIPRKSHVAKLLVTYFHEKVRHQGRLFTEGAVRSNGYWIIGAKRLISSIIHKCVTCRKLRGQLEHQRMSDLPIDRVTPGPPFSSVGVDIFGPWPVVARKTRGGLSHNKRWAVLFTCMTSRAVHIEVIEDMSTSSFINALRRFVSIRGPVKEFRSDRGTNFIGAVDDIRADALFVEKGPIHNYLHRIGTTWKFNPPHASHMGGSWERMIGITRKILDAMFLNANAKHITHEVLCTFMCEVSTIINSRPICPISSDPENPFVISPSMLLTQKDFTDTLTAVVNSTSEIYKSQWKHVQVLSNAFWKQWREGFLQNLQVRRKWQRERPDIKVGDVILLRDKETRRGQWPLGLVVNTFKSTSDQKVRTVEVRVIKDDKALLYLRPVTEVVLLVD